MRILYISNSVIPSRSANSIQVMKMCKAFAENGNNVVLLAPDINQSYEKNIKDIYNYYGVKKNFEIKKLWYPNIKGNFIFYSVAIFFYLLVNRKFDLVYGRFLHGCYVATLLKYKVYFEIHNNIFIKKKHFAYIFYRLVKSQHFKKLIVISQVLKNIYIKSGFLNPSIIQVAHDGADEQIEFHKKIKLMGTRSNLKVGYVGHLYKGKGMEVIAEIEKKMSNNIEIHIIGGHDKDIKFWKKKISNKNVFFYGFLPHKEVSNYIKALDVCLLPNQKEVFTSEKIESKLSISQFTSPLKLFEYMSQKKAIISSDFPVLREVLNKQNSILVKFDDIEMWVKSIEQLKNPKKREKIGYCAFNDFKYYTWKNRAKIVI